MPNRICGIHAISKHVRKRLIAGGSLILLERANQTIKRLNGNIMSSNRVFESDKHRMGNLAAIHALKLTAPPSEQAQTLFGVADLIAKVVGPAAERIDVVEVLMQFLRKQEARDVKVFIMMGRKPARVFSGFDFRISRRFRSDVSDVVFGL